MVRDVTERFIQRMGFAAEEDRLPRISGRILALLLLEEAPLSLDEIAKRLQVSRASVSTNARLLQGHGVIERVAPAGNRRDHYQVTDEPGRELLRNTAKLMHDRCRMLAETRKALDDRPTARRRLAEMEKFYRAVGRGIEKAIAELDGSS